MRHLRVPIVIGLLFCALWAAGSGAEAQQLPPYVTGTEPPSAPPTTDPPPTTTDPPPPVTDPPPPITGADLTGFVVIGAALAGTGAVLVRLARRRKESRT